MPLNLNSAVLDPVPGEIMPVKMTQQYTLDGNEKSNAANFCCDKDLSTHAVSTNSVGEMWLKVEFDKVQFVTKVVVYTRFYNNWYQADHWCVTEGLER